ncbi:aminotransferase class IV [Tritonibacter horizontis]|uniref:Probable branched-chain-amino-acid aminotransferase n=1 Tax=Tritonibacter horizontis TaxID=1768241 RepID=A0A132BZZ1_9RHOB|nr:aminotransferase class IV [Tritonibacter horizontis]KUP93911.1 hypothetical protein TRIHO_12320 [Tritonibacter horizontis]
MENPLCAGDDPDFRLIETFAYAPVLAGQNSSDKGVARLRLHLARLSRSAAAFGIPFDPNGVARLLAGLRGQEMLRCRLTLSATGTLELTTSAMPEAASSWVFAIAAERLDQADPYLRHKTTRRARYDRARAHLPQGLQELVFLNERDELCEGTITNIAVTTCDGVGLTPPLASGCLPGVFRQSLLDRGALREAVLTLTDLQTARDVHLMNAVRGKIPAILQAAG